VTFFNIYIVGQSLNYNTLSDNESSLINDLFSYINDTWYIDTNFVVSPLLIRSIDEKDYLNNPFVKKYGFKKKTEKENNDTLIIRSNDLFEVVNLDILAKYENSGMIITSDSLFIMNPLLYYIEKEYSKKGICYFYKPVFSENKKYAIAEFYIYSGSLSGYGEIVLMENIRNKWKIVTVLVNIMS